VVVVVLLVLCEWCVSGRDCFAKVPLPLPSATPPAVLLFGRPSNQTQQDNQRCNNKQPNNPNAPSHAAVMGAEHAISAVAPPGGCVAVTNCCATIAKDMPKALASHGARPATAKRTATPTAADKTWPTITL
jgi:hypothetical protein